MILIKISEVYNIKIKTKEFDHITLYFADITMVQVCILVFRHFLVFCLETLEWGNRDEGNQRVQFMRRVFIFIATTWQAYANAEGNIPESASINYPDF